MAEESGPVYRASNRPAAWVVLFVSLGAAVVINAKGRPSVGSGLLGGVCVLIAFLALSSLRFKVRAEPRHLVVCSGGPTRRIPWADVQGFGIDEKRGRNVYVVVPGDRRMLLPIPDVRTGKITPTEVRDELQRYWKTHRHRR
jgi:PH (Pleckstrin Homology) domain-containing protein